MSSFRKRYQQSHAESPGKDAPVQTAPMSAAQPPEPIAETPQPPEPIATEAPAATAASSAIRDRLREMERAEQFSRQSAPTPQQQQHAPQAQQPAAAIPAAVEKWLAEHPQYLQDAVAQAELNLATMKCVRAGKSWHDPDFLGEIERHLGLAPATNGHAAQNRAAEIDRPPAAPVAPPRKAAPPRQTVPFSAPPTREAPLMATGRPPSDARLTAEEMALAASLNLKPQEYAEQKRKMNQLKAAGVIQDGR
jgi:hypothetical protein